MANTALKPLFKGIADAIREKEGTTALIYPEDFAGRIGTIQTGSAFSVPLKVTVDAGATVTATLGDTVISGIANAEKKATLLLTAPGAWSVTASLDGKTLEPVTVQVLFGYEQSFSFTESRLPEGYQEVEWIQNSDTNSYINTYRGWYKSKGVLEFSCPQWTSSSSIEKYAVSSGTSGDFDIYTKSNQMYLRQKQYNSSTTKLITIYPSINTSKVRVETNKNQEYIINGVTASVGFDTRATNLYFPSLSANNMIVRVYYVKGEDESSTSTWKNFELIPAINPSGVVGLYELKNAKFFAPTSGTFVAGPIV